MAIQEEIKQQRPFRSLQAEALVAIVRTAELLRRRLAAAIEPHGVTIQQYNVLRILRGVEPDPLPTLEIGERLIEQTPGITRLLDRLEEKGLVRRERCTEDRRLVHCRITEAGLTLLAGLDAIVDAADARAIGDVGREDLAQLIQTLDRIRGTGN